MSSDTLLRVGRVLYATTAEGPGNRTAIWLQGCSIRCPGCINPHLFSARGGTLMGTEEIISGALRAGDEGITLLGGEPFDQAAACASLAETARREGLGVIAFTGYTYDALVEDAEARRLLDAVDLLVDGPYIAGQPETERALVGSTNQRFIALTDRYEDYEAQRVKNRIELRVTSGGVVEMAGFLRDGELKALGETLNARRSYRRQVAEGRPGPPPAPARRQP